MRRLPRARVLLADDHPGILDAAVSILTPSFDVVAAVRDGAQAVDAALRLAPDVIVLDIAMPGLNGLQTAAGIRATQPSAPIVFLSNHAGDDFVMAAMSRGARGFVAKARMSADLLLAVELALEGRQFVPSASVLPLWPRPSDHRHDLQLYDGDEGFVDAAFNFFESALRMGDAIVAVARPQCLALLNRMFAASGHDVQGLVSSGRYASMDPEDALAAVCRDGRPDAVLYAAAVDPMLDRALAASRAATPYVSMYGEIAPLLYARGEFEAMMQLERIADEYAASRPLSILCAYPGLCRETEDVLSRICAEHATIVPNLHSSRTGGMGESRA